MHFNDLKTILGLLHSRRSAKARDLTVPGPNPDQLHDILAAAMRVPDHGKLAPWRFIIIPNHRREALADVIEAAYRTEKPDAGHLAIEAVRAYALNAPTLIVVISCAQENGRIPVWEQVLSAGAACQNLLLAAHALGFIGNWLTGWPAYSTHVIKALGGSETDQIAGFMYIGTSSNDLEERPRPEYAAVVTVWQ